MADRPVRRGPGPAAQPDGGDAAAAARLADEILPALIARLEASALGELEVRRHGWRVRLRRAVTVDATLADGPARRGVPRARGLADPAGGAGRLASLAAVGPGLPKPGARRPAALSPAVGYFSPLGTVAVGLPVRSGDVLGHVDVLGVRQDVVAPTDGVVGRYLAEAGEAVEYGQELVRLEAGRPDEGAPPVSSGA